MASIRMAFGFFFVGVAFDFDSRSLMIVLFYSWKYNNVIISLITCIDYREVQFQLLPAHFQEQKQLVCFKESPRNVIHNSSDFLHPFQGIELYNFIIHRIKEEKLQIRQEQNSKVSSLSYNSCDMTGQILSFLHVGHYHRC